MAGTSEGARKAAQTRGHKSLSEAGRKGGEARAMNRAQGKQKTNRDTRDDKKGKDER